MHVYVVGVAVAVGVILSIIITLATYLVCRQFGPKPDPSKECSYNDFLNRVQSDVQEPVSSVLKKAPPRRIVAKNW